MKDRHAIEGLAEHARRLGLSLGFSRAVPGPEATRLRDWLRQGRHGTMEWLARDPERRSDPQRVLDGAVTIISLGESYASVELPDAPRDRPVGKIARYALGDDYHDVLLGKVRELARSLGDELARPYVDTGPLLEKPLAARAGLGWVGLVS